MTYTIEIQTDHPLVDMTVTNNAQRIAEELGHEGSHPYSVTVKSGEQEIASWSEDPAEDERPGAGPGGS